MKRAVAAGDPSPAGAPVGRPSDRSGTPGRWPLPVHAGLAVAVPVILVAANVRFVCSPLYLKLAYGVLRPPDAPLAGPSDWVSAAANATTDYVAARRGRDAVALLEDVAAAAGDRAASATDPTSDGVRRPPARSGPAAAGGADDASHRALYTQSELEHLADVRRVIARLFALGSAAAAAMALALAVDVGSGRRRTRAALARGGQLASALTLVVGVFVAVAWNGLFTLFHSLLFPSGTWQFPADSRLIQLFPNWFWQSAAAVLAGMLLVEGLVVRHLATRRGAPR